jgi:sugar lactone lactonase YvrE
MLPINCIATLDHSDYGQPVWIDSQDSLFWVDSARQRLYQYHEPSQTLTESDLDAPILSLSPRINNGFIATLKDGIGLYDMQSRKVTYISKPEPFATNKQTIAGVTDHYGNLWSFTCPQDVNDKQSNLYQLSPIMGMQRIISEGPDCTAPPAFSKDGSILYQSSGKTRYIYATRLNEQRQPVETINLCRISKAEGYPHGLCVDSEDNLWICHRGIGLISRYSPDGEKIDSIKIAAPGVKYCTFGGKQMDTLFIVTTREEGTLTSAKNLTYGDAVLNIRPGVIGLKAYLFSG